MIRYSLWLGTGILLLCLAVRAQDAAPKEAEPKADEKEAPKLSEGQLDQLLAPIALYPDDLLSQTLMASTYPLEVVQATRWVKGNKLKGDELAKALEKEDWDPSVKSLVNFPDVLELMDSKLEWTQQLGNAFLAQQEEVMATVQRLRARALEAGNLKDTKEQKIESEGASIVIVPADPEVIYVPVYNTTVVYGTWPYPAYPPYYYYPPSYPRPTLYGFAAGVAVGVAWGYAWGHCAWGRHSSININVNRNLNINHNINRGHYSNQYKGGKGTWQHNPSHRRGVAYSNNSVAQKYNRGASPNASSRQSYRGRTQPTSRPSSTQRPTTSQKPKTSQRPTSTQRPTTNSSAFSGSGSRSSAQRSSSRGQASRARSGGGGGRRR